MFQLLKIIEDCQGELLKIAKETNSPQERQTYRAKRNEVKVRLREAEREHV